MKEEEAVLRAADEWLRALERIRSLDERNGRGEPEDAAGLEAAEVALVAAVLRWRDADHGLREEDRLREEAAG